MDVGVSSSVIWRESGSLCIRAGALRANAQEASRWRGGCFRMFDSWYVSLPLFVEARTDFIKPSVLQASSTSSVCLRLRFSGFSRDGEPGSGGRPACVNNFGLWFVRDSGNHTTDDREEGKCTRFASDFRDRSIKRDEHVGRARSELVFELGGVRIVSHLREHASTVLIRIVWQHFHVFDERARRLISRWKFQQTDGTERVDDFRATVDLRRALR